MYKRRKCRNGVELNKGLIQLEKGGGRNGNNRRETTPC